eukprot:sb/3478539/
MIPSCFNSRSKDPQPPHQNNLPFPGLTSTPPIYSVVRRPTPNSIPFAGLTSTPPIYSVVRRRGSVPNDEESTPKSPPYPVRLHSETSSEGLDIHDKVSRG